MSFTAPYFGLLIIVPLLLGSLYLGMARRAARDRQRFAAKETLSRIMDLSGGRIRTLQWILRGMSLLFLVAALTGPSWGLRREENKSRGLTVIFALDTSKSMLAADILPNRLERSKLAILDFLPKIAGNKVGLIAFAGSSFLQCPPALDINAFGGALTSLSVQSIPKGGTAIGEAIHLSRKVFQSGETGPKILIVITDGENHEGNPVEMAQAAAKEGVTIFTIGIGSPQGERIPVKDQNGAITYLKDASGQVVTTKLDEKVLREIAAAGKGAYIKGAGISIGLDELYQTKLIKYQQSELSGPWKLRPINRYQSVLIPAILLLLLELVLGLIQIRPLNPKENIKTM
ncbi:MAG: VWA domain-containing protein [Firmicutes bacterium]|nr:VWA domain-containing protein [Bacillota bacterium]